VRHNLSTKDCFVHVGNTWRLNPSTRAQALRGRPSKVKTLRDKNRLCDDNRSPEKTLVDLLPDIPCELDYFCDEWGW
jgi:hypothetical protein